MTLSDPRTALATAIARWQDAIGELARIDAALANAAVPVELHAVDEAEATVRVAKEHERQYFYQNSMRPTDDDNPRKVAEERLLAACAKRDHAQQDYDALVNHKTKAEAAVRLKLILVNAAVSHVLQADAAVQELFEAYNIARHWVSELGSILHEVGSKDGVPYGHHDLTNIEDIFPTGARKLWASAIAALATDASAELPPIPQPIIKSPG